MLTKLIQQPKYMVSGACSLALQLKNRLLVCMMYTVRVHGSGIEVMHAAVLSYILNQHMECGVVNILRDFKKFVDVTLSELHMQPL